MVNPSRATTAGRVFNDLRNKARLEGRNTDELLVFYALERFLYRLSLSPFSDQFILKGGLLLATFDARRPTRDADLLARLDSDQRYVMECVSSITSIREDDGLVFRSDQPRARRIRENEDYEGIRVTMPTLLGAAQIKLTLDISFGDPITPGAMDIEYPQLLSTETFSIRAYPLESVLAEKIVTMITLGDLSTRERDWADVWRLTGRQDIDASQLRRAIERTATHRRVELRSLPEVVVTLPELRAGSYQTWRRRQNADSDAYPGTFVEVVDAVKAFAAPLLDGSAITTWSSRHRSWN